MTLTVARPTGHPGYRETLRRDPGAVETARRLVRIALATWGLDDLADDGALIVSELATNAIQHTACCSITVSVDRFGPASVRIAVVDTSKLMPRRRAPGDTESRGRGLLLVEGVSHRWGADRLPRGKRVWGELRGEGA